MRAALSWLWRWAAPAATVGGLVWTCRRQDKYRERWSPAMVLCIGRIGGLVAANLVPEEEAIEMLQETRGTPLAVLQEISMSEGLRVLVGTSGRLAMFRVFPLDDPAPVLSTTEVAEA